MESGFKLIALDKIKIDPDKYQIREDINEDAIAHYLECIRGGISLPPIHVVEIDGVLILADGFHRYHAHLRHGSNTISTVIVAKNEVDGVRTAITNNTLHGVRLTRADRRRAALMYVEALNRADMEVSQAEIAKMLGVSQPTVGRWLAPVSVPVPDASVIDDDTETHEDDAQDEPDPFTPVPTAARERTPGREAETMVLSVRVQTVNAQHEELDLTAKRLGASIRKQADSPLSIELRKRVGRIDEHVRGIRDIVIGSAPDEVCPACNGSGCKTCDDRGWLSAEQAKAWHDQHDI